MDESLKAARLIHNVTIVVAATLLAFALSADAPSNDYSRALHELRSATSLIPVIAKEESELYRSHYERTQLLPTLRDWLRTSDVNIDHDYRLAEILEAHPNERLGQLHALYEQLSKREPIVVWTVAPELLRKSIPRGNDSWGKVGLHFLEDIPARTVTPVIGSEPYDAVAYSKRETLLLQDSWERAFAQALITSKDDDALPALRAVWELVGELDVRSAEAVLARKDREAQQARDASVTIAGVTFKARAVVFAGPLILIALLVYLYAHVQHIVSVFGADPLLKNFPWVPLFKSRLGGLVAYSTVLVLPSVAVVSVVYVANFVAILKTVLATVYLVAVALLGLLTIRKLRRIVGF